MSDPNIQHPDWDEVYADAPFHLRMAPLGEAAGAAELGATLYEIGPGGAIAPYHLHHADEELALVLDGSPTLRTPSGNRRLEPGAVVAFVAGRTAPTCSRTGRTRRYAPCSSPR